jgi:glycosyltransferase involved in cell wall biosynthesis
MKMPPDAISVTLGVGSAAYQKTLVPTLLQAGMLRRYFKSGPYLEVQDPTLDGRLAVIKRFPANRRINQVAWGVWRRIPHKVRPWYPALAMALLADYLWSRWIPPCTIFHSWMGQSLTSMQVAKRQGALTLVENAGRHGRCWEQAAQEEYDRFDVKAIDRQPLLSPAVILRMEREYELCDRIAVPSNLSFRSFAGFGLTHKAVVVLLGTDTQLFAPQPQSADRPLFRVCFVGRVELAKGVGYLLQAWKRLAMPNAELLLVGEVKREMRPLLRICSDSTVRTTGVLPAEQVAARYRDSDLFVIPSVNEGLAQVLLEAMSSGLPVVASDMSGADDCVTDGKEGFIVPARDVDRLAEKILWCYQHRDEARAMGRAGRERIESQFTLDHYNQRQIALYRSMAGMPGAAVRSPATPAKAER